MGNTSPLFHHNSVTSSCSNPDRDPNSINNFIDYSIKANRLVLSQDGNGPDQSDFRRPYIAQGVLSILIRYIIEDLQAGENHTCYSFTLQRAIFQSRIKFVRL